MSSHRLSRPVLLALLVALMVVPPILVLVAIPWLKQQPDGLVFLLAGLAATMAVVASLALAVLHDRQLDEWERSNARFSNQWGWTAGTALIALLLALPPIRDFIVSVVTSWVPAPQADQNLVLVAFVFGFMAVAVAQTVCMALLSIGWAFWMSRSAREPS